MNLPPYLTANGGGGNADSVIDLTTILLFSDDPTDELAYGDGQDELMAYAD